MRISMARVVNARWRGRVPARRPRSFV